MTIRPAIRGVRVPYVSEAFPASSIPNGSAELPVSWARVLWSALTIGRPSVHHVFQYGNASYFEAIFRLSLVRMALEQNGPGGTRFRRTAALKNLDPTEKGAISYFLGMTFCKVFASRLLSTPWLLHLDIFGPAYAALNLGRSRPDLFGQQSGTGDWLSFETKGRASKPSKEDRDKAKAQARRLLSVQGRACKLHVGSFVYFQGDSVHFHWIDPPSEPYAPIEVPDIGNAWRYYYDPARALWRTGSDSYEKDDGELVIPVPELDVTLRVHPMLAPFFLNRLWEEAQRAMFKAAEQLKEDGFEADGLTVECGPSWSDRVGPKRQPISR